MKMFRHLSSVFAIATIAPLALAATLAATPAIAQADQLSNPDWLALLSDYEKNYWQGPPPMPSTVARCSTPIP